MVMFKNANPTTAIFAATLWLAAPSSALAKAAASGRVVATSGPVFVHHDGARKPVAAGDTVNEGDRIHTGNEASVRLLMRDRSLLNLGANAEMTIDSYRIEGTQRRRKVSLRMVVGRLWALVSKSASREVDYRVVSNNAVAGVRGTELIFAMPEASAADAAAIVTVLEGSVEVGSPTSGMNQVLGAMQQGAIRAGGKVAVSTVTPKQARVLVSSVKPRAKLRPDAAATRLNNAAPPPPAGEKPETRKPPPRRAEPPRDSGAPERPPLEIDPSTAKIRVRGKVEVRP